MYGSRRRETNNLLIPFKLCHELQIWRLSILKDHFASQESHSLSKKLLKYKTVFTVLRQTATYLDLQNDLLNWQHYVIHGTIQMGSKNETESTVRIFSKKRLSMEQTRSAFPFPDMLIGSCTFVVGYAVRSPWVHVNVTWKCKCRQFCKDLRRVSVSRRASWGSERGAWTQGKGIQL